MPELLYRFSTRLYALVVLAVLLSASLTFFLVGRSADQVYEFRDHELDHLTELASSYLSSIHERVLAGELTRAEGIAAGRKILEQARFGSDNSGYYFAITTDGTIVAHPHRPDWIGQNKLSVQDASGQQFFKAFIDGLDTNGRSRVEYSFLNPGSKQVETKLGHALLFEPWDILVATGMYIDDVEESIFDTKVLATSCLAVSLVLLLLASTGISRSMIRPMQKLRDRMNRLADGDLISPVPSLTNRSELGGMAQSVQVFQRGLQRQKEMEFEQSKQKEEISSVIQMLSSKLSQMSQGNLDIKITDTFPQQYERLRSDFNSTLDTLQDTISQVIDAASSISNGAVEISQASDDLSHRTESQAATLEETAAALEQMTASVRSAAEGARGVENTVSDARQQAEVSGEVVQNAVSAMTEIAQSSSKISQIISVIDDIAFQTNLLALNAGVEAARAGDAGRGFAVVASEVRGLAQRSSDAAMEIKTLISDSSQQVERGVDLVGKAGDALVQIVDRVSHISTLISGIAEGASEQSTGLAEINTGMTQLDQVTQQNAAMVEEATAAGHLLNSDASKLSQLVAYFQIGTSQARDLLTSGETTSSTAQTSYSAA
ncbi:cache domain-containing protein [Epibacterium ulvae]|nr:cache domain-containing protein [Epibacterium ulvae]